MRKLKAYEIDVRVGTISKTKPKAMLLLYKDSRCDMGVLDEVFGALKWQSKYERIDDVLYCSIGVYNNDIKEWVWKTSNGIESQGTGADDPNNKKGEASDSFKRAGFMWGIGRELYEWKDLWIDYDKVKDKYERYSVSEISYNEKNEPKDLIIVNKKNEIVYELKNGYFKKQPTNKKKADKPVESDKPNTDTEKKEKSNVGDSNGIQAKVKASNKKNYGVLYRKLLDEINRMNDNNELQKNVGLFKDIIIKETRRYIEKDLKLKQETVMWLIDKHDKVEEGYLPIVVNEAYNDMIINIISSYGEKNESEVI